MHDDVVRVGDIHGPSLLRLGNYLGQSDFAKFVVLFGDMPTRECPAPTRDGHWHASTQDLVSGPCQSFNQPHREVGELIADRVQ
jgi:hypothetical protein